jgi:hypothetical protein
MKNHLFAIVLSVAAAVSGCVSYENKTTTTGPSSSGVASLLGNWASLTTSVIPAPSTCADFKWSPTKQTGNSAEGSFSASCAGGLKLSGTATGTLSGTVITWAANANATAPDITSCQVLLAGTAELGLDSVRIPYAGTTCLGPVSGVEILNRR